MSSKSANTISTDALKKARIIGRDDTPTTSQLLQGYNALNDLLESWSLENMMVLYDTLESFTLVAGTGEYTYGAGGTLNSARPVTIRDECFIRSGDYDTPVKLVHLAVYRSITNKSLNGSPEIIAINPEYPLAKVFLFPVPSEACSLYIKASKQLTTFSDQTTAVALYPGYGRALISNLAVELCSDYGKKILPSLTYTAGQSKGVIKVHNSKLPKPLDLSALRSMTSRGSGGSITLGPFE